MSVFRVTPPGPPVVEHSPGVWHVVGSVPGQVIPKTSKMVLGASLLCACIKRIDRGNMVGLPVVGVAA